MFEGIVTPTAAPDAAAIEALCADPLHGYLWEIPSPLKCPVVGLGVTDDEGRRVLKRCGRRVKSLKPWEIHRDLMEEVGGDTQVARRVDALLKRKFSQVMEVCKALPESALLPRLKEAMARGDAASALYCVAMRRDLSAKTLMEVAGEAHMMGHTTAIELFEARKNEKKALEKWEGLKEGYDTEKRDRRALVREKEALRVTQKALSQEIEELRTQKGDAPERLQRLEVELAKERGLRKEVESQRDDLLREVRRLEREKRKLQIRSMELKNENRALADEVMHLAVGRSDVPLKEKAFQMADAPCCSCKEVGCSEKGRCPMICGRRVLMVGGLSRMEPHYRRVAEAKGMGFEYHDGTMSGGRKSLEHQVCRCDMVICPVSCNSHNACQSVKKLCAKHNKELRFLPSSSISALTCAL
ncbi:MAG: DUF2325 domain-containing protein [Desulfobacterales bacterium]|nr:DUF2325 domain-containing protein [Desulfobacterales bacterium]